MTSSRLATHLNYLQRDGVAREGEPARLFDAEGAADGAAFAERCSNDRHHFRFIVSPDDAEQLGDLETFGRDLMAQAERDLGTKLEWVGTDHWNTGHPHLHIVVRGVDERGDNLVIARDYISRGLRDRAGELLTHSLGPRTELEVRHALERQVESERWTELDRTLKGHQERRGFLAPVEGATDGDLAQLGLRRLRKLQSLGLATDFGSGRWMLTDDAERTLRALGERNDIIKRIHRSLDNEAIDRAANDFVTGGSLSSKVTGRLVERGLGDELTGKAYAIVDGVDGRVHHLVFSSIEQTGDAPAGAIVELWRGKAVGQQALIPRSDWTLEQQVVADGSTWLDRCLVTQGSEGLSTTGFGGEVRSAMDARGDVLVGRGLATRQQGRLVAVRNLLDRLRDDELASVSNRLSTETGLPVRVPAEGESISGRYQRRYALASGRFALISDGLGFSLVPWSPAIDQRIGAEVSGIVQPDRVEWQLTRKKGLAI